MKQLFKQASVLIIVSILSVVLLAACSDGGSSDNAGAGSASLQFPADVTNTASLSQLVLEYYGGDSGDYNTDVNLISSGFDVETAWNSDDYSVSDIDSVWFELWDSSADIAIDPGEYIIDVDNTSAGYISWISIWLGASYNPTTDEFSTDYTADINESSADDSIESGTVDVALSGSTYTFTFDLTLADGGSITGTYTGPADFQFDESD